ncbi:MAG: MFS transporter [Bacteroidia bacterium]
MKLDTFRAFRSRNYRLYFTGQSVSLIGTWMQRTAVYWVVYIETGSNFMLGLTVFATQFPSFMLSLWGGVIADRYNRYRVLLTTQVASLVQALLLAFLILFHHYAVWEILLLSILLGIINAFDVPARQSLVYEMVDDKEDLSNAIALNSSMVNLARLIGPAISGIVYDKLGAGICFMLNAASFLAVIVSLLLMRLPLTAPQLRNKKVIGELQEGFDYLKATPSISIIILYLACLSFLVLPYNTLLPVFAKVIFKGNASTFGYLNSFIGLGAISGTLFLASLKSGKTDLRKVLLATTFIFGVGLIFFSHIANFSLACAFATITGFGMMSQVTISNTIIQTTASAEMRGRAISYFAMAFFGLQPLGSLLVGVLSNHIGAPNTILAQGIAAILIFTVFLFFLLKDKTKPNDSAINKTR